MPFRTLLSIADEDMGDEDLMVTASLCEEIGAHLSALVLIMAARLRSVRSPRCSPTTGWRSGRTTLPG